MSGSAGQPEKTFVINIDRVSRRKKSGILRGRKSFVARDMKVAHILSLLCLIIFQQTAKIPKLKCMPSFKKLMKLRKSKTKSQLNAGEGK